ncbi:MAG: right-handed parallel beta-helix repeat-containing protein [Thermoplasmatota archaeon]
MREKLLVAAVGGLLLLSLLMLPPDGRAAPSVLVVPDAYATVQEAVDAAQDGDTVLVRSGVYTAPTIVIQKDICLTGEGPEATVISGTGAGDVVFASDCSLHISCLTLRRSGTSNGDAALELNGVWDCMVTDLVISDAYHALYVVSSRQLLMDNLSLHHNYYGCSLLFSQDADMASCNISHNYRQGIYLQGSSDIRIHNATLYQNIKESIYLRSASSNLVRDSLITASSHGLYLHLSASNTIDNNTVSGHQYGLYMSGSSNNHIFHNRLIGNQVNAYATGGGVNTWDAGYPAGGNYWSDFDRASEGAVDLYHGPGQDLPGDDGIVDSPRKIFPLFTANVDRYPLMPPPIKAHVEITPHTLSTRSKGKWVTCYLELEEGYSAADINVSTILLNLSIPACPHPTSLGDSDGDGILDLMVKFEREPLLAALPSGDTADLIVTGSLFDGTRFRGHQTVRVV